MSRDSKQTDMENCLSHKPLDMGQEQQNPYKCGSSVLDWKVLKQTGMDSEQGGFHHHLLSR